MRDSQRAGVVVMVVVAFVLTPPSYGGATDSIADLAWMCGSWGDPADALESWMAPIDGLMLGVNRTLRPGKTPFFEYLRIEERPEGIVFVASPLGRSPTDFLLRELGPERVVFENPEHDFPQRVAYWLEGISCWPRPVRARAPRGRCRASAGLGDRPAIATAEPQGGSGDRHRPGRGVAGLEAVREHETGNELEDADLAPRPGAGYIRASHPPRSTRPAAAGRR